VPFSKSRLSARRGFTNRSSEWTRYACAAVIDHGGLFYSTAFELKNREGRLTI
jgi:hypothetical protein